ncbi:LysM domain-containing protein [Anoxybacillus vitaminiphilus]|uniref:LysM domain-containing protein n=1 Tax=Paranoxybacillus vitaminiphilus TaxID=581036 RepID=A0A327YZW0_9BACL|nr:cell wall hydrolase [Anoxybacillus vitaminiphilus]RAK23499.1 LysM domain-containing protein [Anoxybacillus vitaminiphilus]
MFKRILLTLTVVCCMVVAFTSPSEGHAAAYTYYKVQKGDTLYSIAKKHKTTVSNLKAMNHKRNDIIIVGEKLKVPQGRAATSAVKKSVTAEERKLMAQLVHAETGYSEPFAGKVEVALVILNRVKHPSFPKSIKGVIYQKTKSGYAFVPVRTGKLTKIQPTKQDYAAVDQAVALHSNDKRGSLYFYNPKITKNKWMLSRPVTIRIGNHVFAK